LAGINRERFDEMMKIDPEEWRRELVLQNELFLKLYHELPKEMIYQRELLVARL
jgi:phosphoenolpyruvate carboxykinase (GTP)